MDIKSLNPTKHALTLFDEFKSFAFKGNVVDLAIGVIIGGAFGNIVKSLVENIITPLVSIILPGENRLEERHLTLLGHVIHFGKFLADLMNFMIVAAALFLFVVKFLGWILRLKKEEAAQAPPEPTKEEQLLTEIRDLLKQRTA